MDVRIYADLNGYDSPCIYTTDDDRPDLLVFYRNTVYVLELTVGFETNMLKNAERKNLRYTELMRRFEIEYETVLFVNLSLGALVTISTPCESFVRMLKDFCYNKTQKNFILQRIMNICIRSTYYIFCRRNKSWSVDELLEI